MNVAALQPSDSWDAILSDAFSSLGLACVAMHAKDPLARTFGGAVLDYEQIAALHGQFADRAPVIVQDVREGDFADTLRFLRQTWSSARARSPSHGDA